MWPKYVAQILTAGAQALGRAFTRAVREEYQAGQSAASRQSGTSGGQNVRRSTATNIKHGLSLQEACQILNVKDKNLDAEQIQKSYEHLFNANDKSKGGSFYIQSKVVRAKERIDEEFQQRKQQQEAKARKADSDTRSSSG